jgi:hypothetical protein
MGPDSLPPGEDSLPRLAGLKRDILTLTQKQG